MAATTKTEPTTEAPSKTSSSAAKYRPTTNWRHGKLFREGQIYDRAEFAYPVKDGTYTIPQSAIDEAVEAGYLEVV
jgi:hypothetical protein